MADNSFTKKSFTGTKQIVLPAFDVDKHDGKQGFIDIVEEGEQMLKTGEMKPVVRVQSQVIDIFNGKDIRVTKLFWLNRNNETGEIGWTDKSELAKFLVAKNVDHYNDLKGKKITFFIQVTDDKKRVLAFR